MSALLPFMAAMLAGSAEAAPTDATNKLPEAVRAMIVAAIATGDAKSVEIVVRLAKETNGFAAHEIDQIYQGFQTKVAESRTQEEQARRREIEQATVFDRWKGQVELGASRATGNTRNLGLYGALSFDREGLAWSHKLNARADLQETNGVATTERLLASWQPKLRLHERFYAYGIAEYEHDRFQGYDDRYTLGGGGGFAAIATSTAKLDLEGGPAFRHVDYLDRAALTTVAARASLNLSWAITPTLELKQNSSVYLEPGDSSANALSVIDAKLLGPLKARFSYDIRYESVAPAGGNEISTQSRATLVYSF